MFPQLIISSKYRPAFSQSVDLTSDDNAEDDDAAHGADQATSRLVAPENDPSVVQALLDLQQQVKQQQDMQSATSGDVITIGNCRFLFRQILDSYVTCMSTLNFFMRRE